MNDQSQSSNTTPNQNTVLERHGFTSIMRWPDKKTMQTTQVVEDYFLKGVTPTQPFIGKEHRITAFGSCFAGEVSRYLAAKGYRVNAHQWEHVGSDLIRIDEIMVHTPALRAQFEWAFLDKPLGKIFIGGVEEHAETYHALENVREIITSSDVYIVTLGLTEAWYDVEEQQYLWKFIPHRRRDAKRFINKHVSYQENSENIAAIYNIIRQHRPDAQIIFTLSPIPLLGTYSGKGTVVANTFSKATLRAALGEFIQAHAQDEKLFYFPSYEIVTEWLPDPWEEDRRHVSYEARRQIMHIFHRYFLTD